MNHIIHFQITNELLNSRVAFDSDRLTAEINHFTGCPSNGMVNIVANILLTVILSDADIDSLALEIAGRINRQRIALGY